MPEILGRLRSPRLSSPPGAPTVGEMYYDTGQNQLLYWNGTAWVGSGGSGSGTDGNPIGMVTTFSGQATLPFGYVLCDGASYTQGLFPQGYAFAQAEVAAGNPLWTVNTTNQTFTVPDLRDRFILSAGARALGVKSVPGDPTNPGEISHALSLAELPAHDHGGSTATGDGVGRAGMTGAQNQLHTHSGTTGARNAAHNHISYHRNVSNTAGGGSGATTGWTTPVQLQVTDAEPQDHQHAFSTGTESVWHWHGIASNGSNGTHNNMPPYCVIALMVKIKGITVDPSSGIVQGPPGARGSAWYLYNGIGTPAAGTFAGELNGDWAIRKADGEEFQRVGGVWVDQGYTNRSTAATTSARAYRSTAFTMTSQTWQAVPLNAIDYDTGGNFNTTTGKFVCPTAGYYLCTGSAGSTPGTTGILVGLQRNATTPVTRGSGAPAIGAPLSIEAGMVTDILYCNPGDTIALACYPAGADALYTGISSSFLSVALITAGPGANGARGSNWFTYAGAGTPATGTFSNELDGDMAVRSSDSEVFKRVSGVWTDQGWKAGGTLASTPVVAKARRGTGPVTVNGWTKVPMDTMMFDSLGSICDTANGRMIVPYTGYYQVSGQTGEYTANEMLILISVNGAIDAAPGIRGTRTQASGYNNGTASGTVLLNKGDYVELYCYTTVSSSLSCSPGDQSWLSLALIQPGVGAQGAGWKQYAGAGSPTISGNNGDFCVRTSDGEVFQMTSGAWADQGWSVIGSSNLNATYAARACRGSALSLGVGFSKIPLDTKVFDPGNNFSTANGRYVCPVAGYYNVSGEIDFNVGATAQVGAYLYKNGVQVSQGSNYGVTTAQTSEWTAVVSDVIQCNAGDYLELWAYASAAEALYLSVSARNYLAVTLVGTTATQQQPLQPASQARAWRNAALNTSSGFNAMPLDTISYDSGGNFSIANNQYTCPVSGYYQVNVEFYVTATAAGQIIQALVNQNGGRVLSGSAATSQASGGFTSTASDILRCNAGDTLQFQYYTPTAGLAVAGSFTYMSVTLVGTTPTSAPAHAARAWLSGAFTTTANTWVKVPLDGVSFDPGGNYQTANRRYVCPVSGIYDVLANVACTQSATGTYTNFAVGIMKNGAIYAYTNIDAAVQSVESIAYADKIQCNAGDYLELIVYNAQGTAVGQGVAITWMAISLLTGSQIGPMGPQGPAGAAGAAGAPGAAGNSIDAKTAAKAYATSAQSLPNASAVKISYPAISFDAGGNFSTANSRYVCPVAGYYQVEGSVSIAGVVSVSTYIEKNGVSVATSSVVSDGTHWPTCLASDVVQCNAGDYLELWCYAYGAVSTNGGVTATYLSVVKVDTGGPPGPTGPMGALGGDVYAQTQTQTAAQLSVPQSVWTVIPAPATTVISKSDGTNADFVINGDGSLTIPKAGNYSFSMIVMASATPLADNTNLNLALCRKAGATPTGPGDGEVAQSVATYGTQGNNYGSIAVACDLVCAANDRVQIFLYQTGAAASFRMGTYSVARRGAGPQGPQGPQGIPGGVSNTAGRAYRGAAMSMTASNWAKIPLDTISSDSGSHVSTVNGRYVCSATGQHQVDGQVAFTVATGSVSSVGLYKNGSLVTQGGATYMTASGNVQMVISDIISCVPGDYIELWAWTNSATSPLVCAPYNNYLAVVMTDQSGPQGPPGGAANQVVNPYAITPGYTADRGFTPGLTSLGEVATVLATLIDDMKASGLIHA